MRVSPTIEALPFARLILGVAVGLGASGCGARTELEACLVEGQELPCSSFCGTGVERCVRGHWEPCNAPGPKTEIPLETTVRDFQESHPDFESVTGDDPGMLEPMLDDAGKPIYAGHPTTPTTNGKEHFDEWYHDVPGVNKSTSYTILLSQIQEDPPFYRYDDQSFFPIDNALFGNEGHPHNYHFTLELNVEFRYNGGEKFTFNGDDDLWVFINRRIALDLGGVHVAETASVDLDASAGALGIAVGDVYTLSLFFAERHTTESHFRIDTSIAEFNVCPEQ